MYDVDGYDDVSGDVLGDVLGIDTMGMDTVGARRRRAHHARRMMALPPKPQWRQHQLAPGVQSPREGLEPLPLVPDTNGGTFSATVTNITFRARPQRPFRGERLLAQVLRTGTSATGLAALCTGVFVGTALQQLQIGNFNLEFFGSTAFGVRMDLIPSEPGIDIALGTILSGALAANDTINVQLMMLGRSIGA